MKTVADRHYTYYDFYTDYITPKLEEIDLFIKTSGERIECLRAAEILDLRPREVYAVLSGLRGYAYKPIWMTKTEFFEVMMRGDSLICGLYRRETECGSPLVYSRDQIAYIYDIDIDKINSACDSMHMIEMTAYMLPEIFERVEFLF